jgi:hypothetical protein
MRARELGNYHSATGVPLPNAPHGGIERWGSVSLVFLVASALSLPLTWTRHTAIEQQIKRLPQAVTITTLCAVPVLTGTLLVLYLTTPARFL